MIPDGYGVATMHWSQALGMQDITCTCGFLYDPDDGSPNDAAEAIESYWIAGDSPCDPALMFPQFTFIGVTVLCSFAGALNSGASESNTVGANSGLTPPVSPYTPQVVTKRSALAGVQYRGRMYPPVLSVDAAHVSPDGVIAPAFQPAIATAYSSLFAEWSSGTWAPVLLHNAPKVGLTPDPTPVTSFQAQTTVGIQRRRKGQA